MAINSSKPFAFPSNVVSDNSYTILLEGIRFQKIYDFYNL